MIIIVFGIVGLIFVSLILVLGGFIAGAIAEEHSLFAYAENKGNTAQFKAHGLLEYYSVSLPQKSRQGVSLTLIYLYNLTKNLAAQSAHLNYAVLPKCKKSIKN